MRHSQDTMATPAPRRTPDKSGRFGPYGGRYVPETLIPALDELERSDKETALVTLCVGAGMGTATVIERV